MVTTKKLVLSASVLGIALAAPITFSSDGIEANDACAQNGTCCASPDTCIVNGKAVAGGYWYTGGSSCPL